MKKRITTFIYLAICMLYTSAVFAQEAYVDTLRTVDGRDSVYIHAMHVKVIRDTIWMQSQVENPSMNAKVIRDTVWMQAQEEAPPTDIIKTKAIGRYDRRILNYRYIPKGNWIGGITFSYMNFDSNDNQLLFSLLKDFDFNGRTLSVKPFVGFAVANNIVLGVKFGYNHTLGSLDNLSLEIDDDLDFSLHDIRYVQDLYSFALFHRSYVGLDRARRFGLFNEVSLGYNTGTTRFSRNKEVDFKATDTRIHELHVGINPGVCVFIMENVSAELSFGVVGFKYRYEKQTNNLGEVGHSRNSGADFKINLLNINIGITLCF